MTPTNNEASQQGDAKGDSKGNGLNDTLFRCINASACHVREHICQAKSHREMENNHSAEIQQSWINLYIDSGSEL